MKAHKTEMEWDLGGGLTVDVQYDHLTHDVEIYHRDKNGIIGSVELTSSDVIAIADELRRLRGDD